jgi:dihydroxyacetone kinase-like predicted kinase
VSGIGGTYALGLSACCNGVSDMVYSWQKDSKTNLEGIKMLEYKYDTQLLIEGKDLDEDEINDYFRANFKGDCLLAVGDEELIKIHFHTNEPWKVLEYCSQLGEIYDIVVEDMDRQARGLKG